MYAIRSYYEYYIEQSSNRYTVDGDVTDWIAVPGNAASYDDDLGGLAVWQFLTDSLNGWYAAQLADGKTPAEIDAYLSQFVITSYSIHYTKLYDFVLQGLVVFQGRRPTSAMSRS